MPVRKQSPVRKASSNSHHRLPPKKKKSAKPAGGRKGESVAKETKEVTILAPAAMENLYYIAHSAVDALEIRGFGWEGNGMKKKKGGRKGKKKK